MKGTNLGEFEELVLLTVLILQGDAYIIRIIEELKVQAKRSAAMGALHATLSRLEDKGYLQSELAGGSETRGGRRKRVYELTAPGKNVLQQIRDMRNSMWSQVPTVALK